MEAQSPRSCYWIIVDEPNIWSGTCGIEWEFIEDGPTENGCNFCPRCGGRVVEDTWEDTDGLVCGRCDGSGSAKTYANQAQLPINGKVRSIDWCIHHIVAALNAGGVETVACCCGHGEQDGRIDLADGRILVLQKSQ